MALRRWSYCVVLVSLAFTSSIAAQPEPRRVLLLSSFERHSIAVFAQSFRRELSRQSLEPINFFEVSVRATPFSVNPHEESVVDYVKATTAAVGRFDLVVSLGGTAAGFVEAYGERLFPTTPIIEAAGDSRFMSDASASVNRTTVAVIADMPRAIDNILQLLPNTTRVFVVSGNSAPEVVWRKALGLEFERFKDRLTFIWLNELSFAEILKRSSALPPNSAIFFPTLVVDGKGVFHSEERALAQLHAVANAPIFAINDFQLGEGIVGGSLIEVSDVARDTAAVALRILGGESPGHIKTAPQRTGTPTYDWRELQRWGISEARLPAGSIVEFRPPRVWDQYRAYVLGATIILGLQSALIAGLVVQRVRRRRVEQSLRESEGALRESNRQNQDLAGRLITAQEVERARIARELHDDVCQRLAGLSMVLGGFRRRISESKPESDVDETLAMIQKTTSNLSNDVRHLSHELHSGVLQYAGLAAALKEHCAEFGRHHHLDIRVDTTDGLGALDTNIALCLYRVTQEALANTARHARARVAQVRVARTLHGVELDIVDDGVGFDPEHHNGHGLGLQSIGERVRFAKGSVRLESQPGHGTRLSVRIPLSAVPADVVASAAS